MKRSDLSYGALEDLLAAPTVRIVVLPDGRAIARVRVQYGSKLYWDRVRTNSKDSAIWVTESSALKFLRKCCNERTVFEIVREEAA